MSISENNNLHAIYWNCYHYFSTCPKTCTHCLGEPFHLVHVMPVGHLSLNRIWIVRGLIFCFAKIVVETYIQSRLLGIYVNPPCITNFQNLTPTHVCEDICLLVFNWLLKRKLISHYLHCIFVYANVTKHLFFKDVERQFLHDFNSILWRFFWYKPSLIICFLLTEGLVFMISTYFKSKVPVLWS